VPNKYSNRIFLHEKFWIAPCSFRGDKTEGFTKYALLKPGQKAFKEIETFLATSDQKAIERGIDLAKKHSLFP